MQMKNLTKRMIAGLMVFFLTGAMVPSGQAAEASGFSDVPDTAWYAEAVNWCIKNDIMSGVTAVSFAPDSAMTRASTAEALYRAAGQPAATYTSRFSDVSASASYFNAVSWTAEQGIMSGYGGGTFGVGDPVTREQLAAIFWRYAGSPAADAKAGFSDEAQIAPYAQTAVDWAKGQGVINGKPGNLFAPKDTITRAQVAAILYRYMTNGADSPSGTEPGPAVLLYQGQASMRIMTNEGKVIYIDPYVGEGYDLPADLILVTHAHYDHNGVDRIENRNLNCQIITWKDAIQNGEHQVFDLGYVTVEAVEAGYNRWHDVSECVGYVLTFSNGKSIYVTGDTSTTEQMADMAEMGIDYAFFCCDGVFNMGLEEAAEAAKLVGAKHNIPYHVTARNDVFFDRTMAEQFDVENRLILDIGETLSVE